MFCPPVAVLRSLTPSLRFRGRKKSERFVILLSYVVGLCSRNKKRFSLMRASSALTLQSSSPSSLPKRGRQERDPPPLSLSVCNIGVATVKMSCMSSSSINGIKGLTKLTKRFGVFLRKQDQKTAQVTERKRKENRRD